MKPYLLALIAGLAAACGFQPLGLWPLTLLAFAFLMRQLGQAPTMRRALGLGWSFAVGHFILGLNWIATAFTFQSNMPAWLGWIAVVLLSVLLHGFTAKPVMDRLDRWRARFARPRSRPVSSDA